MVLETNDIMRPIASVMDLRLLQYISIAAALLRASSSVYAVGSAGSSYRVSLEEEHYQIAIHLS